jgi:predicted Zn-dependent peptidase
MHKDNSTPIVAVSIMYHVGSKDEDSTLTGFAHFFEHLLFEGTENIPRGQYDKYVEKAGGTLNANTSWDRTYYYEILPSNQLELGLWLESERMLHAKVESIGIETQRNVIQEERKQTVENRPYGRLLEELMKRVYKVHPYRWPIIGSMEHIRAAEENDFQDFYAKFYVPDNAVLSIAGDIDYEETQKLVKKYFSTIPSGAGPIVRNKITEPPLNGEVRDTTYDNIQLPAVVMAYRIPAAGTPDYYALSMLGTLLSQGESSRLQKSLVDEKQLAVATGSFAFDLQHPGVSMSYAICNMGADILEVEDAITSEIERLKTEEVSDYEFQKLRNQIENDFVSSNSRMAGIAQSLATYKTYYNDANLINTELDKYLAVTKDDLKRVSQKYFSRDNRVVLHYLPQMTK